MMMIPLMFLLYNSCMFKNQKKQKKPKRRHAPRPFFGPVEKIDKAEGNKQSPSKKSEYMIVLISV